MTQMEIEKTVTQMEHVTAAERSAGRLDEDKLQRLQAEFDEVGWCRLGSVVDAALLGRLEGALDRAAAEVTRREDRTSASRSPRSPQPPRRPAALRPPCAGASPPRDGSRERPRGAVLTPRRK